MLSIGSSSSSSGTDPGKSVSALLRSARSDEVPFSVTLLEAMQAFELLFIIHAVIAAFAANAAVY